MKLLILLYCLLPLVLGALQISGVTATQAVFVYTSPSDHECQVQVSESAEFDSLVNDVNGALFTGANTDAAAAIGAATAGERVLVVGKRTAEKSGGRLYSRALRADTDHHARITCDGEVQTATFRTAQIAGIVPAETGFNPDGHGNWGMPDFDWMDRTKPVIDPLTGAAIYRVTDPRDAGFHVTRGFVSFFGGSGWNNTNNVLSGSTGSLARTGNTEPIFLVMDTVASTIFGGFAANEGWPRMSALAAQIFGSGTDASSENRQLDVCISVDSGQSCYTDPLRVTLPRNSAAALGAFPAQFPSANFTGWSRPIPSEHWTTSGYVTVNGHQVTLTRNRDNEIITYSHPKVSSSWFRPEWRAGTRIFIAGSSPTCPGNYCTVAAVQNRTSLTIQESLSIATDANYKSAGLGLMMLKTNATGTISVSANARVAAYLAHHAGTAEMCSRLPVTTTVDRHGTPLGRSITGYLCVINRARDSTGRLYFIGESEPEFRLLSMNAVPNAIPEHANSELPRGAGFLTSPNVFWSATDPNVYYLRVSTNGNSPSVFRLVYSGDYRENGSALWSYSQAGNVSGSDPVKWENLFRGEKAVRSQILARTTYNEERWPSLGNLVFGGLVGSKVFFYNLLSTQDLPCAVFTFDATTGIFERWFDTLGNGVGGLKFAGCHALRAYGDRIFLSAHTLTRRNVNTRYGGPFVAPVTHLLRGGASSTNTSLPEWTNGSYDSACPTDIPQLFKNMGATGNECLTVRLSGEPCSAVAEASEKNWTPCPWDSSRSWIGKPVEPGDVIQDYEKSIDPGTDIDSEYMLVLQRRELGGGAFELVMLRDSATGYACQKDRARGRSCVALRSQAQHTTGWSMMFRPLSGSLLYDPVAGAVDIENDAVGRGHFDIVALTEGRHTFVGITGQGYGARVNSGSYAFAPVNLIAQRPAFAGNSKNDNFTQSYPTAPTAMATGVNASIASDWRHINSVFGADWESPTQTVGEDQTFVQQPGTTQVYRITLSGSSAVGDYKREKLLAWAGQYVLEEKSGPGTILTDADVWRFCYAYRAGECQSSALAGQLFAVVPNIETTLPKCHVSQVSFRAACFFSISGVQTQVMQVRIERNDPAALRQRAVGHSLTRPGAQYVYSSARMFGNGTRILSSVYHHNGWFSGAVMIDPGSMVDDSVNRTTFEPVQISGLPPNSVVEFGYNQSFHCTARAEACRVAAPAINEAQPFSYAHEALAGVADTITIPALPGRVLYYRVLTDGVPHGVNVLAVR